MELTLEGLAKFEEEFKVRDDTDRVFKAMHAPSKPERR